MGTLWSRSNSIERDNSDVAAPAAKAYFFVGGTTTPLTTYSDAAEASPRTHPVVSDGNGRWPSVFIPFCTSYDVQVTTSGGTALYYPTQIPNADPVEAVADAVDDEELIATGMVVWEPVDTTRAGFVRLNGRTIGSATSGGTERANADCEDLFLYLWNNIANGQAAVSTGRGGSAAADWAANKTITLLNGRGALLMGLDTMGNSAGSYLTSAPVIAGSAILAGSLLGENTHALTTAELATHLHTMSFTSGAGSAHDHGAVTGAGSAHSHTGTGASHTHTYDTINTNTLNNIAVTGAASIIYITSISSNGSTSGGTTPPALTIANESAHTHSIASESSHTHLISGSTANNGSGTAHNVVPRVLIGTFYQKL